MKELLEIGLWIGGGSLVMLSIASFWIPKALGWREKLAGLTPLMRELWWTYSIYVWSSHVFFAVLTLGFGEWLLGRTGSATAMSTFMLLWWSVRLWLQFFGFDLSEVEGSKANRIAKQLLTLLFIGLVVLFGGLVAWNAGWIGTGEIP
ncbi:hypothetical protein OKA04_22185 [Luteolibacter flavescens]|uniref:Uncharacterized protein n=1 Tax=Luteolibacter flavescens TaxID=1859460 RepID=A0ABT3FV53_9BACT|nr:hypothetical protein [Luteolibacter flavescens]MCW1887461.1 hypothetical protein [Luteolibacter flavescens]